ncbi:MAG: DMP19 family protein, partial [Planctomycetes bacterium]|nr:DMP19 family protein [Planctomycetota bacterium]
GLRAIGARQDLELSQKAIEFFGPDGPSTDRNARHMQLAKVVKDDDEVFSPLESEFYEDKEDREVLLMRYIVEHEADFR